MNTQVSLSIDKILLEKGIDMPVTTTIADVAMMLYEKHGIWIEIFPCKTWNWVCFNYKINKIMGDNWKVIPNKSSFDCYIKPTEAYDAAILFCLENVIK